MNEDTGLAADGGKNSDNYSPPTVTHLGSVADLTQKEVGAFDGTEVVGIQLGSV